MTTGDDHQGDDHGGDDHGGDEVKTFMSKRLVSNRPILPIKYGVDEP
jgi:hypothetical protein